MVIDPYLLAADIYNELADRKVHVPTMVYSGRGWWLRTRFRGGLILGVPVVECDAQSSTVTIKIRKLFSSKPIAMFRLADFSRADDLIKQVCDQVVKYRR